MQSLHGNRSITMARRLCHINQSKAQSVPGGINLSGDNNISVVIPSKSFKIMIITIKHAKCMNLSR